MEEWKRKWKLLWVKSLGFRILGYVSYGLLLALCTTSTSISTSAWNSTCIAAIMATTTRLNCYGY